METQIKQKLVKKRSWVWSYFDLPVNNSSQCNICHNKIPYLSSTTPLSYHLNKVHNIKESARKKLRIDLNSHDTEQDEYSILNTSEYDDVIDDELNSKKLYDSLLKFIIGTNQPLSIVENKFFQELLQNLNKSYKVPSRSYLTNKLIPLKVI